MRGRVAISTPAQAARIMAHTAIPAPMPPSASSRPGTTAVASTANATAAPIALSTSGIRAWRDSACSGTSRENQMPHSAATASPARNNATDTRSGPSIATSASHARAPKNPAAISAKSCCSSLAACPSSATPLRNRQPKLSLSIVAAAARFVASTAFIRPPRRTGPPVTAPRSARRARWRSPATRRPRRAR